MSVGLISEGLNPVALSVFVKTGVTVTCNAASSVLSGANATIVTNTTVSGPGASLVLSGAQAGVSQGTQVNCGGASVVLSGAQASVGSGVSINCDLAGVVVSGASASVVYAIQSLPITNNTNTPLPGQAVSWSWFPGGRIGSFTGISPVEGTAVTDGLGRCQTTATPGPGVLMIGVINSGASTDGVCYEGF